MAIDSTTRALRKRSRARVLRAVLHDGETTRLRLAAALRLSAGTVTNVVADLMTEGLIRESGVLPSDGGRPSATLAVDPLGAFFVGADVGEHGLTVELFDLTFTSVASVFRDTTSRTAAPEEISKALSSAVDEVISAAVRPEAVYGVGLGMPGIIETTDDIRHAGAAQRLTIYAQSLQWPPTSLEAIYARTDLPIFADNGGKTLAMAESWFGASAGVDDSFFALLGRGIGAGVMTSGRLLHGSMGSAAEWGHTKVSIGGPRCACGNRGCLESYVGGSAISRRWREAGGMPPDDDEEAVAHLLAAAANDASAKRVVDETIEILGIGLANMVNLFNPQRIVLGGWAGLLLAPNYLDEIADATRENSLGRPAGQFEMVTARVGRDGVALGAALLAVEGLINEPWSAPTTGLDKAAAGL